MRFKTAMFMTVFVTCIVLYKIYGLLLLTLLSILVFIFPW